MFGPDLASIRGKTVQRMPAPVVADYVAIPQQLVDANQAATLAADMFFVDGIAFLITVSRRIKFVTTKHLPVRTATSLSKHLQQVLLVYGRAGFRVRSILMDGEFEKMKGLMPTVECNTTTAKEHVSKAERSIRTVKERTRGIVTMLPFTHIPRRMKIEFVYFTVLWLNTFPVKTGISSTYLPQEILVRWQLDYKKLCRVLLGTYCKVHDEPDPSNSMVGRTHKGITLGPMGNIQGSVNFLCLNMGRVLKWQLFTALPMPTRVIKCVDTIGVQEAQGREFCFLNRNKDAFTWTDEVPADNPAFQGLLKEEEAVYPDITAELQGVPLEEEVVDHRTVMDKDEPDYRVLMTRALDNANINPAAHLLATRAAKAQPVAPGPALIDADEDKIIYKLTFDLPDVGLAPPIAPDGVAMVPHDTPNAHAFEPNPGEDTKPAAER
jgi:hypothetical protein